MSDSRKHICLVITKDLIKDWSCYNNNLEDGTGYFPPGYYSFTNLKVFKPTDVFTFMK
jgi:hypothetical protein